MELLDLETGLKSVAAAGNVLNCQELIGLQSGLALLKAKEKLREIFFWGKVFGQTADYYVAYGLRTSDFEFPTKLFFYSGAGFQFEPLVAPTGEAADKVAELSDGKPLTGDPGKLLEQGGGEGGDDPPPADDGDAAEPPPKKLSEADQLAQLVQEIDFETSAVPKGAYFLDEKHTIVANGDFRGLVFSEALSLANYVHFRAPIAVSSQRTLARTDVQFLPNFLDPLEGDLPHGCWLIRKDPSAELVTLRSLNWPGYVAYHVPGSKKFGGAYFGYAQKSLDLPFLL